MVQPDRRRDGAGVGGSGSRGSGSLGIRRRADRGVSQSGRRSGRTSRRGGIRARRRAGRGPGAGGRPPLQRGNGRLSHRRGPHRARRRHHGGVFAPSGRGVRASAVSKSHRRRSGGPHRRAARALCRRGRRRVRAASRFRTLDARGHDDRTSAPKWEELRKGTMAPGAAPTGTVGAVARDARGRLAAATSTGGILGKKSGRVGDSPIVGAGTFADDEAGAASATGQGEGIMRTCLAKTAVDEMRRGASPRKRQGASCNTCPTAWARRVASSSSTP